MSTVVHVVSLLSPERGGPSVSVPALAAAVAATRRYNVCLVALNSSFGSGDEPLPEYLAFTDLGLKPWQILVSRRARCRLEALIRPADIVHVHGIWEPHSWLTGHLASKLRKPYFVSAHGMLEAWALRNKRWKKALYSSLIEKPNLKRATCLRALTVAEARDYRRYGLSNPVAVVPNGIRTPTRVSSDAFLGRFPHLRGKRLILFLGRVHYKKGPDLLCRAWGPIAAGFPHGHLVLAGPDSEGTLPRVAALVAALGIEHCVSLTGMLNGDLKWSALAASEVFVLPSYSEGLPVAVLEAMATGTPVVITRQCNLPEVAERECGLMIEPTVDQLEQALRHILALAPEERARLGGNGRRLVFERFDWTAIGHQMASVYDWVLGGPQPQGVTIV